MGYNIEWDGHTVTFPPVGDPESALPLAPSGEGALQLSRYAASMFSSTPGCPMRITLPVVLIPIGKPWDPVSVAAPQSVGGDKDVRHLGFLDNKFIGNLERSRGNELRQLAELSCGEIRCTAIVERDPDDLIYAYTDIKLDLPSAGELASAIKDFGRVRTDHVLDCLRTFETREVEIGTLSVTLQEGLSTDPSSLNVVSDGVHIGQVELGYLYLDDERQRATVLGALDTLAIPAAAPRKPRPESTASFEWDPGQVPNVVVRRRDEGHSFNWVPPAGPSRLPYRRTFAFYTSSTKTLWVEDQRLVAPGCALAARLGLEIETIRVPLEIWTLGQRVRPGGGGLQSQSPAGRHPHKVRELHPRVAELVPENVFTQTDLARIAQADGRSAHEPTELLERLTPRRRALFPDHTYLDGIGTCRICERPAGQFRTPICAETLAYCHRCLALAAEGLPNSAPKQTIARATAAVRALADHEFRGAAFVEAQLTAVAGDPEKPAQAIDIDRSMLLRIAITRRQLPWTHILIDAGLADNGVRLSRGTALKAIDGHLCSSMLEKAVDDFLHEHGIDHTREPLYPFDDQLNPNTRLRADWLLSDGTFVEMWGMPDDPAYADRMRKKKELAARCQLRLLGITPTEIGSLRAIFADLNARAAALGDSDVQ